MEDTVVFQNHSESTGIKKEDLLYITFEKRLYPNLYLFHLVVTI